MRKDMVLVRDLWDCGFDINCFVKIYDGAGSDSWHEKKPIYSGFGSEDRPPEEVLGMRVSYITTDNHQIVIEAEKLAENDSRKARLKAALQDLLQDLYDAASVVSRVTDDDDYECYPGLLDEWVNVVDAVHEATCKIFDVQQAECEKEIDEAFADFIGEEFAREERSDGE